MASVSIHPPKTPVTQGSSGVAKATLPNVCKMPGPPAPFVPSPLPNIAKSGQSPKGYSTSVKIEGNAVAIRGASFESTGDVASKGTGGGLLSANTHGPAKFLTPGSLTVSVEGKSVHLLGEPMLNNLGPSGSPPNTGATMTGLDQADQDVKPYEIDLNCKEKLASGKEKDRCDVEELCAMIKGFNESKLKKEQVRPSPSNRIGSDDKARIMDKFNMSEADVVAHNVKNTRYGNGLKRWARNFRKLVKEKGANSPEVKEKFTAECRYNQWKAEGGKGKPPRKGSPAYSPDHVHDAGQGGPVEYDDVKDGLKWVDNEVNRDLGTAMKKYDPKVNGDTVVAGADCQCD